MTRKRISRAKIKAAIPDSGGVIAAIARRAGYSWRATRDYINADPELSVMLRDEEETVDDMAESVLIKRIRDGDDATARWWLTRRRRNRYGDNMDVTSNGEVLKFDYSRFINTATRPVQDSDAPSAD
jgi:hypothetical protein